MKFIKGMLIAWAIMALILITMIIFVGFLKLIFLLTGSENITGSVTVFLIAGVLGGLLAISEND